MELRIVFLITLMFCILNNCDSIKHDNSKEKFEKVHNYPYEIVSIDSFDVDQTIARIFIVSDTTIKSNICAIIQEISDNYEVNSYTDLSFYTKKEYAKYIDEVYNGIYNDSIAKLFAIILNEYYWGEFNFKSKIFTFFPRNKKRKEEKYLKCIGQIPEQVMQSN
ncbi:MAG: hypothetical protein ACPGVD_00625 [Flavobacteriales bacterium]